MPNLALALEQSIASVAEPGGVCYTERQLYYEVCRTLQPLARVRTADVRRALAIGSMLGALATPTPQRVGRVALGATLGLAAVEALRRTPFTFVPPVEYPTFAQAFDAYQAVHGAPAGLVATATPGLPAPLEQQPELTAYGLRRLLVCQDALTATMLRANWLHTELSCPVLALAEALPLPAPLAAALAATPNAHVYLLHDASAQGLAAVGPVAAQARQCGAAFSAVGLRPAHVLRLHLFAQPATPPQHGDWPPYLTARERRWLQRDRCVAVAALTPFRLLRGLRRTIALEPPQRVDLPDLRRERQVGFMSAPAAVALGA